MAVEHRVVDDRGNQFGELLGPAEALRERGVLGQRDGELVGDALGQSGGEQARRNRQHPDAQRAEVARHGQAHARDPGLGGGVGHLADLAFEGGDGGGVDDHAAFLVFGVVGAHVGGGKAADVEGRHQVQVDDGSETVQAVRAGLAQRALGDRAAGRGEHDVQTTEGLDRGIQCLFGLGEVGDVDGEKWATQARGNGLTVGTFPVEDRHLSPARGQQFRAGPAEPGCATDDDDLLARDLHAQPPAAGPTGTLPPRSGPLTSG